MDEHSVSGGSWPRMVFRFYQDLLPAKFAKANDGAVAPSIELADWVESVSSEEALQAAVRANDKAAEGVKTAEAKAQRLAQVALALLTIAFGVASYQAQRVRASGGGWRWIELAPVALAIMSLALAGVEAIEIDRVGFFASGGVSDAVAASVEDRRAALIAAEERGRLLAQWTSRRKLSSLMQARAWLSRGLLALAVAGLVTVTMSGTPTACRTIQGRGGDRDQPASTPPTLPTTPSTPAPAGVPATP
jgi:hypothetical protein